MSRDRPVLVTGFEPFGGEPSNPSEEIARALDGRRIHDVRVVGRTLPCVFSAADRELDRLLREIGPRLVVGVGQAGGRPHITPERVALNVDDARIPDNAGAQPIDRPIVRRGPAAYWSTLPIKAIVSALQAEGIPASVSQTAGTFVCNHVFYRLMHRMCRRRGSKGGFIHVPYTIEQAARQGAGVPGLPLAQMVAAIAFAIDVSLRTRRDLRAAGGAVS
jgi:pyroglutamyl-peptidase